MLEGHEAAAGRATVRVTELFDRLVRYRNREIGHGAVGQRTPAYYDRVGRALLAGVTDVLDRLDPLAGRRLLYVSDVRRQAQGRWLVERYELRGETARRLESLDLADGDAVRLLPDRLYLESVALDPAPAAEGETGDEPRPAGRIPRTLCLYPLLVHDADAGETLFLNARRGRQRVEYLSYHTGREEERTDLTHEHRRLLARVLHVAEEVPSLVEWAARSRAEEPAEDAAEEPPAAKRRLGEFELLSELGRGGMGVVYRAWQPSLGRQVAVKALFRTGDPKAEARFAREIRALGRVEHPHLVKIFLSGSDGDRWYYAMELIEGTTLAAVCDKLHGRHTSPETVDGRMWPEMVSTACAEARQSEKPVSSLSSPGGAPAAPAGPTADAAPAPRFGRSYVRQAAELVRQVAEAAHALHERNILHRDIKPGNVMVTADGGQAVLMDLGLAQLADEVEGLAGLLGQGPYPPSLGSAQFGLRGAIAARRGDGAEGERLLRRAVDELSRDGFDLDTLPWLYELRDLCQRQGRTADAVAAMARALDLLCAAGADEGGSDVERWLRHVDSPALTRLALERHFPDHLLDLLMEGRLTQRARQEATEVKVVTVLFSDVRDYTTLSEGLSPPEVLDLLNEWFAEVTRVVRHHGFIDKFIGDAVMALFGVRARREESAADAVRAALGMRDALAALNLRHKALGRRQIRVGIGVCTGPAVVGFLGSHLRLSYTAIGDTVNVAARLESATKEFHCDILIGQETEDGQRRAGVAESSPRGLAHLKGKGQALPVYEVIGWKDAAPKG